MEAWICLVQWNLTEEAAMEVDSNHMLLQTNKWMHYLYSVNRTNMADEKLLYLNYVRM